MTSQEGLTNPDYWDCECSNYYIHPKSCDRCKFCGQFAEDSPDSHSVEVELMKSGQSKLKHACDLLTKEH